MTEAATTGVLYKKVFLEISQNSQENTCTRASFLIKLQATTLVAASSPISLSPEFSLYLSENIETISKNKQTTTTATNQDKFLLNGFGMIMLQLSFSYVHISLCQKHQEALYKKTVLKNFAFFTGKYLCLSLF